MGKPIGYVGQDSFLNSVIEVETGLSVEDQMGRVSTMFWGPRVIDLDILLYNGEIVEDDELIIPHPLMHNRRVVLIPLVEIAPDVFHPKLKMTASELLLHNRRQKYC